MSSLEVVDRNVDPPLSIRLNLCTPSLAELLVVFCLLDATCVVGAVVVLRLFVKFALRFLLNCFVLQVRKSKK